MAKNTPETSTKQPAQGEKTKTQAGKAGAFGFFGEQAGFTPAPPGRYEVYRKMRSNPTVALARIASTAPVRSADLTFESLDGTPEQIKDFIKEQLNPMLPTLIKEMLFGLDYGFQAFEKVWEVKDVNGSLAWVYKKIKQLRPEMTKVVETKKGVFGGLKQGDVILQPEKSFLFTYDGEAGNPYGRSRHENIREYAWHPWNEIVKKQGKYITKVAGVIPIIEYPQGESRDKNGNVIDNFDVASNVLDHLGRGNGVAMPNVFAKYTEDLARQGVDPMKLKAWHISFLETKGNHSQGFTNTMRHYESLMMRGWFVPERAAIEGQFGTKAEAGTHADLAITIADELLQDMLRCINWYIVNPLLVYNFGSERENSVYISRAGMDHATKAFLREIASTVLSNPANVDLFLSMLDIDAILDATGLPVGDKVDTQAIIEKREPEEQEVDENTPVTNNVQASIKRILSRHAKRDENI